MTKNNEQIIIDKDKFEKAENEPINQEALNKFIEETDKFYIDDLDARCPYHCSDKVGQCNNPSQETPHTYCIDNKDCIYKQYAHKEQECEKAKQNAQDTYDLWQALIESFNILQGEKIKLEQECEELKEINSTLLEYRRHAVTCQECYEDGLEDGKTSNKELKQLKKENEELKKLLMQKSEVDMFLNTPIEGWSNDPCGVCPHKAENEQLKEELSAIQHNCNREGCRYYNDGTFKVFYECKAQKALQLSANSITTKYCDLLQTLEDIKEIAERGLNCSQCSCGAKADLDLILQKINEVENE